MSTNMYEELRIIVQWIALIFEWTLVNNHDQQKIINAISRCVNEYFLFYDFKSKSIEKLK